MSQTLWGATKFDPGLDNGRDVDPNCFASSMPRHPSGPAEPCFMSTARAWRAFGLKPLQCNGRLGLLSFPELNMTLQTRGISFPNSIPSVRDFRQRFRVVPLHSSSGWVATLRDQGINLRPTYSN